MMVLNRWNSSKGFTLLELMISVMVGGILASIILSLIINEVDKKKGKDKPQQQQEQVAEDNFYKQVVEEVRNKAGHTLIECDDISPLEQDCLYTMELMPGHDSYAMRLSCTKTASTWMCVPKL